MNIFDTSLFMSRSECGQWGNWQGLFILADVGIWLSYMMIPVSLIFFGTKKSLGLRKRKAFVGLFALFIFFCGFGHFFDALTFYWPAYRFLAIWHLCTMVVSWGTAIVLPKLLLTYLSRE